MQLFPYQETGSKWLVGKRHALLADEMGLGKTVQAIRASDELECRRILVICPAVVRGNWRAEFEQCSTRQGLRIHIITTRDDSKAPAIKQANVVVVSYDLAVTLTVRMAFLALQWDLLILDESHYLKNPKAKRTRHILTKGGIGDKADRVWFLTGTPMPNYPNELWVMLRKMGQTDLPYTSFERKFCSGYNDGYAFKITGAKNTDQLKQLLAPVTLRRRKDQVMTELPPILYTTRVVEPEPYPDEYELSLMKSQKATEQARLEAQQRQLFSIWANVPSTERLEALKAVQSSVTTLRRHTGLMKVKGVADFAALLLDSGTEKVVIFAVHRDVIKYLREELRAYNPVIIFGGSRDVDKKIKRFQGEFSRYRNHQCRVLIGQVVAAGVGITLTAASQVILAEQSWVPAENAQAIMRVHRIGQTKPVTVTFCALDGSIDEKVTRILRQKTEALTAVID